MFGIGGSEILVILVIALLFLGPDKLPDAAKTISKGIRDLKKQSRALQQQIESDERIGGAIRDLKSALRGEDLYTPPVRKPPPKLEEKPEEPKPEELAEAPPPFTLPQTAGEADPEVPEVEDEPVDDIAQLIKPAPNTAARPKPPPLPRIVKDDEQKKHG